MIAIIDYDAGNLRSVEKALRFLGQETVITRDRQEILDADKVILPGVGAFGDAMRRLCQYDLVDVIHQAVRQKTPFLGLCLGMQLMFEGSEESEGALRFPTWDGILWISGRIPGCLQGFLRERMCILSTLII